MQQLRARARQREGNSTCMHRFMVKTRPCRPFTHTHISSEIKPPPPKNPSGEKLCAPCIIMVCPYQYRWGKEVQRWRPPVADGPNRAPAARVSDTDNPLPPHRLCSYFRRKIWLWLFFAFQSKENERTHRCLPPSARTVFHNRQEEVQILVLREMCEWRRPSATTKVHLELELASSRTVSGLISLSLPLSFLTWKIIFPPKISKQRQCWLDSDGCARARHGVFCCSHEEMGGGGRGNILFTRQRHDRSSVN